MGLALPPSLSKNFWVSEIVDPFTLLAAASAAVSAVKKGCQLYKDVKSAAGDVSEVLRDINNQFAGKKVSKEQAKQIAEKKAELQVIAKSDPHDVMGQIGEELGKFFDVMDQVEKAFFEQERKAKQLHHDGDGSLRKMALDRVLIQTRLEAMQKELREILVYQTAPELGAMWSKFSEMWEKTLEEQKVAQEEQFKLDAIERWRKKRIADAIKDKVLWLAVFLIVVLEISALLWSIRWHKENGLPWWLAF